jgi:hypothetical protein
MKTASAKQKGRKLQQWVRDVIKDIFDLGSDDVRSTSMGAGGEDILLSKAARSLFPFTIECKAHHSFAVYGHYDQARANGGAGVEALLIIKGNNRRPLAIVDAEWFIRRMRGSSTTET